jgi:ketosteroid isomerase-like protein
MRHTWMFAAIAVLSLTPSASAQEQVDQNTRKQIEQIIAEYHDAWNNHNAAGVAALYTKDGILITQASQIVKHGQQNIEKNYEGAFATLPHHDSATADEIIPLGSGEFMSVGAYHLTGSGNNGPTKLDGHWTAVYVPEGGKLKIKMLTAVPDLPPAPTAR